MLKKDAARRLGVEEALEALGAAPRETPRAPRPTEPPPVAQARPPQARPPRSETGDPRVTISHVANSSLEGLVQTFSKDAVRVGRGGAHDVAVDRRGDR